MINKINIVQNNTGAEEVSNECIPKLYALTKSGYVSARFKGLIRPLYSFRTHTSFLTRRYSDLRIQNISGEYYEWNDPEMSFNIGKSNYFGDSIGVTSLNNRIDITGTFTADQCPLLGNKNIQVIDLRPFTNIQGMKNGLSPVTVIPEGTTLTESGEYQLKEVYVRQAKTCTSTWHPTYGAVIRGSYYTLEKAWFENSGNAWCHPFNDNGFGNDASKQSIKHFYFKNNYVKPGFDIADILSVDTQGGFPYASGWQSTRGMGKIKNFLVDSKIPLVLGGHDPWEDGNWSYTTLWVPDWQFDTYTAMIARITYKPKLRRISEYWNVCSEDGIDPDWWRCSDTQTYMDGDIVE